MRMDKHRHQKPATFRERTENVSGKIVGLNCVYIALIFKKEKNFLNTYRILLRFDGVRFWVHGCLIFSIPISLEKIHN